MQQYKDLKRLLKQDNSNLPQIKVALIGDTATQFLATSVCGMGVVRGYNIRLFEAEYNQVSQQFMNPSSELHQYESDYVVVFESTHKLCEKHSLLSPSEQTHIAEERIHFVEQVVADPCFANKKIIYFNYPELEDTVFGSYSNKVAQSFTYQTRKLNFMLMELAERVPNLFICDIAGIQNKFGRDFMFASNVYVSTEMVLSIDALPYVASRVMDIICANQGQFKKCLILDLDNTLWGGVVGDDGWENIQIGHGLGIGKAFTEFQQWIKKLKQRGIIIAVCSKNDEDKAKEPFEKNPEMVLKLDDICVFIANWENKADNIRAIQSILNIGFDSMVFIDDNPFERNMVRQNVPDVTVPEMPEDPADYLEYLYTLNLFETASFSTADKDRTKQYQIETQRVSASKSFTNEADFLKSLNMMSKVKGFDNFNTPRVAQLSQRSNQFNLRTIRYTEDQIHNIENNDKYATFSFTLEDKFGDNGLIAVVILEKKDSETLFIDTWFMSCRVLKRGMEDFTLNTLVGYAKDNGFKMIVGEYIPTQKNAMVKDHYPTLGFEKIPNTSTDQYVLNVNMYKQRENYINVK